MSQATENQFAPPPGLARPVAGTDHLADSNTATQVGAAVIHRAEQTVYLLIGFLLVLALLLALAGAGKLVLDGFQDWSGTEAIFHIIDRLLFVLMLAEILHTVHSSIRSGSLLCEPFLIVGLIACIRRVLVITLEMSQITAPGKWDAANVPLFNASMLELGVLGGLIVVLVGSIRIMRSRAAADG